MVDHVINENITHWPNLHAYWPNLQYCVMYMYTTCTCNMCIQHSFPFSIITSINVSYKMLERTPSVNKASWFNIFAYSWGIIC